MVYEHNIKNDLITIEDEKFLQLPWVKELSLPSLHHIDYIQAHLSLFYKNNADAVKALRICERRKFLTEKRGVIYNVKADCYVVVIICELIRDKILPRCNQTWQEANYD